MLQYLVIIPIKLVKPKGNETRPKSEDNKVRTCDSDFGHSPEFTSKYFSTDNKSLCLNSPKYCTGGSKSPPSSISSSISSCRGTFSGMIFKIGNSSSKAPAKSTVNWSRQSSVDHIVGTHNSVFPPSANNSGDTHSSTSQTPFGHATAYTTIYIILELQVDLVM